MLIRDKIQIPFVNTGTTTLEPGAPVIVGDRLKYYGVIGVTPAQVEPGQSGILDISGEFSFNTTDVPVVAQYQQVYAFHDASTNKVTFTLSVGDKYVYAGIASKARASAAEPLVLLLGVNNTTYKAASPSTSSPSNGGAGAMSDSSTTVDPSSSSEPGAM